MAAKARTRRMSFVLPRKFDESAIEYIRNRIVNSNRNERESAIKAIELNSRNAPIYISEVRCLPGDGDTTLCLLHTNGSQFQFTRWYTFLSKTLSFVERMDQKSKLAQIDDFASRMRHLDSESVFPFDVPDQRTPTKKRSQLETEDEAVEQPVTKQLVLSTPEKSSLTRVPGSSSTVMMRQTILTGASQPLSSQLGGEPLLSQHRAVGYEGGSVHAAMFTPSGGAMAKLGDYLVGRYPTYKGHKTFEGRKDGESAEAFRDRARKQRNSVPTVGKIMTLFLPPVLQSSKGSGGLFAVLSAGHAELLVTLQKMCCKGVYSPSMTPDSQELSYGVDCLGGGEMSRKSCFLELWRRALNLERALADLLKFLLGMVECVTPSTLKTVSLQTLGNLRALLLSGAGLYGGGSDFWNARSMACIEKLNEGGDPRVHETITWLSGNRANAFSVLSPFIEELNVLLPTLAQIALIKDDLCRLDDEATAQGVFNTLNDDRKLRMNVHTQCCGWLIVYGGKLTWYVFSPCICLGWCVLNLSLFALAGWWSKSMPGARSLSPLPGSSGWSSPERWSCCCFPRMEKSLVWMDRHWTRAMWMLTLWKACSRSLTTACQFSLWRWISSRKCRSSTVIFRTECFRR